MGKFRRGDSFSPPVTTRSSGAKAKAKTEKVTVPQNAARRPNAPPIVYWFTGPGCFQPRSSWLGSPPKDEDESHDEEPDDTKDLERGKPKFCLAVIFNREAVQHN